MNVLPARLASRLQRGPLPPVENGSLRVQRMLLFVLATAVPLVIVLSLEMWTVTSYTSAMSLSGFLNQYTHDIYRYRVVGREAVLFAHRVLAAHLTDKPYPLPRDPGAEFLMYAALAVTNATWLFLSNLLLLGFLWKRRCGFADRELSGYLYYTLILTLSLAVVTPYDQLAYLLLLVGIAGARAKSLKVGMPLVTISALVGTLNRETEFLLAAFLATMALFSSRERARKYALYLAVDLVLSCAVYVMIRMMLPGHASLIGYVTLGGKWGPEALLVLAMLVAGMAAISLRIYNDAAPLTAFLIFSLPYLLTILVGGEFRELRLMTPILLSLLCIYVMLERQGADDAARDAICKCT